MRAPWIAALYDYSRWATERILNTAAALPPAALAADRGAGYGSVLDALFHTMMSQQMWFRRFEGDSPAGWPDRAPFADLASIRAHWAALERDTAAFIAALTEERLAAVLDYRSTRGVPFSNPLWLLLIHQVNHATQHRAEIAFTLSQLGHSPGDLDFVMWARDHSG